MMIADSGVLNVAGQFVIWLLLVVMAIAVVRRIKHERRQKRLRGFEVKLNTGETPVLREKETNHG